MFLAATALLALHFGLALANGTCESTDLVYNGTFTGSMDGWDSYGTVNYGSNRIDIQTNAYVEQVITVTHTGIYRFNSWIDTCGYGTAKIYFYRQDKEHNGYSFYWNPSKGAGGTVGTYIAMEEGEWKLRIKAYACHLLLDDVEVYCHHDFDEVDETNLLENGDFDGWYTGWEPNGVRYDGGPYADDYYSERGAIELDYGEVMTQVFTAYSDTYSFGGRVHGGAVQDLRIAIHTWPGLSQLANKKCRGDWILCQSTVNLGADDYQFSIYTIDGHDNMEADDLFVTNGEPPPGPQWGADAWLYYPYKFSDGWGIFQTYSSTTWYGDDYENYWVWIMRPGAYIYPIAPLDIYDVGINSFGYYIYAFINAWPDVPSTTIKIEGLQSLNVSPGQHVGVNCELGTVGPNPYLGDAYHLLLYTEFDGSPYNPEPYMSKYPDGGLCVPTDPTGSPIGPGAGEVPSVLMEVCQSCNPPSTWTNFGRWIVWLECMIQNLFMCELVEWINGIINLQILALQQAYASASALMGRFNDLAGINIMILGRLGDTGAWMAQPVNGGLEWLDAAIAGALGYSTDSLDDLGSRIDNLGYIIMSYAGGGNTVIYQEASTNYWDVVVGILTLMTHVVDLFAALIGGLFDILIAAVNLVATIANLGLMLVTGVITGITGASQDADMIVGATNITNLSCTQTGAFAASGASQEKALCFVLTSLGLGNLVIEESAWRFFPGIAIGILALGLVFWIMGQFREILPA